jgi:hypothetical protein
LRANNDPLEDTFATQTDILCNSGRISLASDGTVGQKDMTHHHELLVSGKHKKTNTTKNINSLKNYRIF